MYMYKQKHEIKKWMGSGWTSFNNLLGNKTDLEVVYMMSDILHSFDFRKTATVALSRRFYLLN